MRSRSADSPRFARRLIEIFTPAPTRSVLLGDIEETFQRLAADDARAARRWYWRQCLGCCLRMTRERWGTRPARRIGRALSGSAADFGFAARALRKQPGFTVPTVAIFVVGVAANALVFSFVDAVMIRSLPYPDSDRIMMLWPTLLDEERGETASIATYRHAEALAATDGIFAGLAAYESAPTTLRTPIRTTQTIGLNISADWNDVVGIQPWRGRAFTAEDDRPGASPVAIISFELWRDEFGADPGILGREVSLDGEPTAVIGVMPEGFWFFDPFMFFRSSGDRENANVHLWLPLHEREWTDWVTDYPSLRVMARVESDVSPDAARAAAAAALRGVEAAGGPPAVGVEMKSIDQQLREPVQRELAMLLGASLLVLGIVSANLGSLALTRADGRRTELAIRAALGAGRWRLVRFAIAENLWIAILGGSGGLAVAALAIDTVVRIAPRALPLADTIRIDARVAAFGIGLATLGALAGGLLPMLRILAGSLPSQLSRAGKSGGPGNTRTRTLLVVAEVAVSVTLLVGAALMLRTMLDLRGAPLGFNTESVLTFQSHLTMAPETEPNLDFYPQLLRAIEDIPGVVAAGGTTHLPFSEWGAGAPEIVVGDQVPDPEERGPRVGTNWILPGYLAAANIDLLQGDALTWDQPTSRKVVVNAAFVDRFLEGKSPLGTRVGTVARSQGITVTEYEIGGVIANTAHSALGETPSPRIYIDGRDKTWMQFVVRTRGEPTDVVAAIREVAQGIDPEHPLYRFDRWQHLVDSSLSSERFYSTLLGAFGMVALLLAAAGVYGTVSYAVSARLPEYGVRKALGADNHAIARMVVRGGLQPVLAGLALGVAGAATASRAMSALLHDTSSTDPVSFAVAVGVFFAAALLAVLPPARRAASAPPAEVLRTD